MLVAAFDNHRDRIVRATLPSERDGGSIIRSTRTVDPWCASDPGSALNEIVRQQWNFSPPESVREVEEYQVELSNVAVLELVIKPDIGGGVARASLKNLRLS